MKFYLATSILLLVPLVYCGVIRYEQKPTFRIIYDKDQVNSLSIGPAGLYVQHNDDSLVIKSNIGSIEIKNTNESFVVESVPPPSKDGLFLDQGTQVQNANENEKYDVVNDKLVSTTEAPATEAVQHDCMDSPLKHLIVKCDGQISLRPYTEEERAKAEEQRKRFKEQMDEKMNDMRKRIEEAQKMFEKSFQDMRSGIFGKSSISTSN